jgi:hypothetical protein
VNRTATANGSAQAVETQAEPGLLERVVEATQQARQFSLEEVRYMAEAAAKSEMYGLSQSQAFVMMMLAEAEGLHPIQAVRRFDIIEGKPTMKAAAMQAEFTRHGGKITWRERTAEVCSADFSHPVLQPEPLPIRITLEELKKNGVAIAKDGGLKKNYRQYPRSMLHARVISEGVRAVDPGIVVGLYTPEEASDFDDRPSPRPQPADAPASRVEPVVATPEAPASTEGGHAVGGPTPDGFWTWLQCRVDEVNNDWASFCVKEKQPHEKLIEHKNEALNGVITMWLEKELIRPEAVNGTKKGTRSNFKMRTVIELANAEDEQATKDDFDAYFDDKWAREATALGINLDAQPPEEALSNA